VGIHPTTQTFSKTERKNIMRKYYITRKSAVTTVSLKVVNSTTFEVSDDSIVLDGAFSGFSEALKVVNKVWEKTDVKPIAVTGLSCKIKTLAMTAQQWFDAAEVVDEKEVTAEEAASFGKRAKKSDSDAQ
jgi:hypothetical protein